MVVLLKPPGNPSSSSIARPEATVAVVSAGFGWDLVTDVVANSLDRLSDCIVTSVNPSASQSVLITDPAWVGGRQLLLMEHHRPAGGSAS